MLLGDSAADRLEKSHVAVFGLGGVGSYTAEALARSGIGKLTLVDDDLVSKSNINRQLCALESTLGTPKCHVVADRLKDINPEIRLNPIQHRYESSSNDTFFKENYDFVADAIDLVSCKLSLIENCLNRDIPVISALGTGNKLDASRLEISDISKTSGCPFARVIRRELRNRGILSHSVVYSPEPAKKPENPPIAPPGRRSVPGSLSWVPACAGMLLAQHIVLSLLCL